MVINEAQEKGLKGGDMLFTEAQEKGLKEGDMLFTKAQIRLLASGYLTTGETCLDDIYLRLARTYFNYGLDNEKPNAQKFLYFLRKGYIIPSTPILCYSRDPKSYSMPISCFINEMQDNMGSILRANLENNVFTVRGGGCGTYYGALRPEGEPIRGSGSAPSVVAQICADAKKIGLLSQSGTRRGAIASYIDINHEEIEDFIKMRSLGGDKNKRVIDNAAHHGVVIDNDFMYKVINGDVKAVRLWQLLIETRITTGEPFIVFKDAVKAGYPKKYIEEGLEFKCSNLCTEITLATGKDRTAVCCLASLDIYAIMFDDSYKHDSMYELFKDKVEVGLEFLSYVIDEFCSPRHKKDLLDSGIADAYTLERAIRSAKDERSVGLGVMGYRDARDEVYFRCAVEDLEGINIKDFTLEDLVKMNSTHCFVDAVFDSIKQTSDRMKNKLGLTHALAIAPTATISKLSPTGDRVSPCIEKHISHMFVEKDKLGVGDVIKSRIYKRIEAWDEKYKYEISIKNRLTFLDREFLLSGAFDNSIDSTEYVKEIARIQLYICQAISFNMFIDLAKSERAEIENQHLIAWASGIKTLYYLRTKNVEARIESGPMCSLLNRECESCQ